MELSNASSLAWLVALLLLQGIAASIFYALSSASKTILRDRAEEGDRRAQRTLRLVENATVLLTTQQFLSIFFTILSAAVMVRYLIPAAVTLLDDSGLRPDAANLLGFGVLLPLFAFLMLIVGHQLPSSITSGRSVGWAMLFSGLVSVIILLLTPFLRLAQLFSQEVGKMLGGAGSAAVITEEEIKTLVDASSEGGAIDSEEKELIYSVFKFSDTLAREVMVPRIDMEALEINTPLRAALEKIIQVGHSRIPVYEDSIDNIQGLLYAKDLLQVWHRGDESRVKLRDILRQPYMIPESKPAVDLLTELQQREVHLAIVMDEYGGTAGLVTIEDLLEEIVGEIRDEYDALEEAPYEKVTDTEYVFLAGIDLDDVNDLFDIDLPTDDNDTLGGFIFSELGEVPEVGDKIRAEGVEMEVLSLDGRRIHKVRVYKVAPALLEEAISPEQDTEATASS